MQHVSLFDPKLKGSGRTRRMLETANDMAHKGCSVIVVFNDDQQIMEMRKAFPELLLFNKNLSIRAYSVIFDQAVRAGMRMTGFFHPEDSYVYFDHSVVEQHFGAMIKQLESFTDRVN